MKNLSDRELINRILSKDIVASDSLLEEVALRFKKRVKEYPSEKERDINTLLNVFECKEYEDKERKEIMANAAGNGAVMHEGMKYLISTEICIAYRSNGPGVQVQRKELLKAIDLDDEDIKYFKNKYIIK